LPPPPQALSATAKVTPHRMRRQLFMVGTPPEYCALKYISR
jgi:hypothetical protein